MLILEAEAIQPIGYNFFQLGGYGPMSIVTLLLIALFFAAWKAPAWVKEVGLLALAFGFLWTVIGFIQAADFIQGAPDIEPNIVWGGVKVGLLPIAYGFIVYIVSLIIRIIKKPRI